MVYIGPGILKTVHILKGLNYYSMSHKIFHFEVINNYYDIIDIYEFQFDLYHLGSFISSEFGWLRQTAEIQRSAE